MNRFMTNVLMFSVVTTHRERASLAIARTIAAGIIAQIHTRERRPFVPQMSARMLTLDTDETLIRSVLLGRLRSSVWNWFENF